MYSRRISVELVMTVFTLQRCTDNFEYPLEKGNLRIMDTQMVLMLVHFLCFAISAMKSKINSIFPASACNELPLPSHPPYVFAKYIPSAVDSTQPQLIWCICFTDPSKTAIKYPSLSCAFSTSLIVVAI